MAHKEISAGGVVYKHENNELYVQLIIDRYGKVSIAKGKMEQGESVEETALREIEEETGILGEIIAPVDIIAYTYQNPVHGSVNKEVHYYLVEATSGQLKPQLEEINDVSWYNAREAWHRQQQTGYRNNDIILRKALSLLGISV
ncbi:NUDIX hydrolase [Paenibacillus crassostreae]|uniref:NTP pyrophosphohydrolase n=1 Tax=Paenibacillus crassostreae TaxID=1763538 RepID=A0A167C289_9BACL|nr:NUDIX domain-containing protein [Paenibacillus crassostreae]AOZ91737.1 NTP pyrophosphohydrolase [Paenibacillus crassostreae]OAB72690.1 NTP pyrophosphohydrolase [Paenibacillus crassostreae]